jgi:hypothetical protein
MSDGYMKLESIISAEFHIKNLFFVRLGTTFFKQTIHMYVCMYVCMYFYCLNQDGSVSTVTSL